jgi:hypothetical protein
MLKVNGVRNAGEKIQKISKALTGKSYSYNKTNQMHSILKFILGMKIYMFRTISLSIIRSLALYTQQ